MIVKALQELAAAGRMIAAFWRSHGTKALGTVGTFLASSQAAVLVMNPSPLSPQATALLAGANAFFAAWTVKRGFYNSGNQSGV